MTKGKLTKLPRAEQWADRICTQLGQTVGSIIGVGQLLLKAKADLTHGEWLRMFDEDLLPFRKSWAAMFMAIASNQLLSNFHDRGNLPPVVGTLYQLTKAEPAKLKNALKDGIITSDMPRKAVVALLPSKQKRVLKPKEDPNAVGVGYRSAGSRLYFRIAELLSDEFDSLSLEEQDDVLSMLDQTLNELRQARQKVEA